MNTVTYDRLRKIASESQITADMLYPDAFQYITGRHKPRKLVNKDDFSRLSDPDYVLANALGVPRNLFAHSAAQRVTPKQAYTMAYTNRKAAERDWDLSQAARKRAVQQLFGNDFVSSLPEDTVYPGAIQSKLDPDGRELLKSRLRENFYGLLPGELLGGLHHLKAAYNSKYYPERLAEDNMDRAMEQLRDKKLLDSKTGLLTDEIFSANGYSAPASTVNSAIEVKQLPQNVPGAQGAQKQIDEDYAEAMPIAKNSVDANTFRGNVRGVA